jgi:hypothetical protein
LLALKVRTSHFAILDSDGVRNLMRISLHFYMGASMSANKFSALICAVAAAILLITPPAQAQTRSILLSWVGKDPVQFDPDGPHNAIWSNPAIQSSMLKTLGSSRFHQLTSNWGAWRSLALPVERVGDMVAFTICSWHQCEINQHADIFISLRDGSVQVCWLDLDSSPSPLWLSPHGERKLHDGYCRGGGQDVDFSLSRVYQNHFRVNQ